LARLLIAVLIALLLVRWFQQGAVAWKRTPLDLPLLAFVGTAALSSLFAVNRNVAIFGTYDRWEGLLSIVSYALLFWLSVQLLSSQAQARGLIWSVLISGYVVGAVAVLQVGFGLLGGGFFQGANGIFRADATLANPDFAGIFLAMLLPISLAKVVSRRSATTRVLAGNLLVVLMLGLVATFTRAAWIGALLGVIIVLVLRRGGFHVRPLVASVAVVIVGSAIVAGIAASTPPRAKTGIGDAIVARLASIVDLRSVTQNERIATWADTVPLIASRPILGYGPDTFGLVYPRFETSNKLGVLWDKPHQDALGVAASQGILGLLAYIWMLVVFVRAFWKGRHLHGAVALFGGWAAYLVSIQFDFSWIPTSFPFWLVAAAAIVTWVPDLKVVRVTQFPRRIAAPSLAAGALGLLLLMIPALAMPYLADADYYGTQAAGALGQARATIAQARRLAPYEATYAAEAGNYALNLDQNGNPASNADWTAAQEAYQTAAHLGSYSPEMFRELAIVDEYLGDHTGAVAAAKRALELDRYDTLSKDLVARLTARS